MTAIATIHLTALSEVFNDKMDGIDINDLTCFALLNGSMTFQRDDFADPSNFDVLLAKGLLKPASIVDSQGETIKGIFVLTRLGHDLLFPT